MNIKLYTMWFLEEIIRAMVQGLILWFLWSSFIIMELTMLPSISFACMFIIVIFIKILLFNKYDALNMITMTNIEYYMKSIHLYAKYIMSPIIAKSITTKPSEAIDNTDETE